MKVTVVGTGYVGLVAGVCFADMGNNVICVDVDENKVKMLRKGEVPIYEPGVREVLLRNIKAERISFTTDIKEGIQKSEVIFIAVGTPMGEGYEADLKYVKAVARDIGKYINGYKVVVDKSTVPVGTADLVEEIILESMEEQYDFDVVSNPEFLKEGEAIRDFTIPERIVVGANSDRAKKVMEKLYGAITRVHHPIFFTDVKSAEIIKYASNSMLATRISFMNDVAKLCEKVGANVKDVSRGMGLDTRIGPRFLQAGVGYGGSCFPKDVQAFIHTAKQHGLRFKILEAVEEVNQKQKESVFEKVKKLVPDLEGKKVAIWGLAFKPNTDDMREAPALVAIPKFLEEGAKVYAFDPEAMDVSRKLLKGVNYCEKALDCINDADVLVILTEWNIFRDIEKKEILKRMKSANVFDGRNIYDPDEMANLGFNYLSVGRPDNSQKAKLEHSNLSLRTMDDYKKTSLVALKEQIQNHFVDFSLINVEDISRKVDMINAYPNLKDLKDISKDEIFILDENDIDLNDAEKVVLNGEFFFEHTCAGEATRLGLGTKYLLNLKKLSLESIAEIMQNERITEINKNKSLTNKEKENEIDTGAYFLKLPEAGRSNQEYSPSLIYKLSAFLLNCFRIIESAEPRLILLKTDGFTGN